LVVAKTKSHFLFKVTYVDCSIETVISIPCNLFDTQFEQEKKYGEIKNSELKKASASLKKFVKINWNSIDLRGKIEFKLASQKYKYCFDEFGKFTDGVAFYENGQLFKLIKKTFPNFCT